MNSPANYKELFNLRHSQAWNVVERVFGVAKKRFKMLQESSELPIKTQTQMVCAMAVLHNFIMLHDPDDLPEWEPSVEDEGNEAHGMKGAGVSRAEVHRSNFRRDQIAQAMWAQYKNTLESRRR